MTDSDSRTGRDASLLAPTLDGDRLREVLPMLSKRQREVARLMLGGYSYRRMADKLRLGDSTVRNHIRRIRQVMKMSGNIVP